MESDRKGQGGKGGEEGPGMGKLSVFSENRSWNTVSSSSSKPVAALDKANFFKKQKLYILKMYNTLFDIHMHSEMITIVKLIKISSPHIVTILCM